MSTPDATPNSTLGRTLSDVLAKTARKDAPGTPARGVMEVDLTLIRPPGANPRQDFDEAALAELTESIKIHGILQPLVVLRREGGYEILSGERRYRASRAAGLVRVPVVIREESDPQHIAELRLIENIQRSDLNPLELAQAYQVLIDRHGLTQDDLARRLGKERSSIANHLRLLKLPSAVQHMVGERKIAMGHAKVLAGIDDAKRTADLADRVAREDLSVRALEELLHTPAPAADATDPADAATTPADPESPGRGAPRGKRPPASPQVKELESNLMRLLGVPVQVKGKGKRTRLIIRFPDNDDFQRVVTAMEDLLNVSRAVPGAVAPAAAPAHAPAATPPRAAAVAPVPLRPMQPLPVVRPNPPPGPAFPV